MSRVRGKLQIEEIDQVTRQTLKRTKTTSSGIDTGCSMAEKRPSEV